MAIHIALLQADIPHRLVSVDRSKRTSDGRDLLTINPRGFTPTLELDDGTVLTEALALLVYIAERAGTMLPADGLPRWRALEATSFLTTELHRNFRPFFRGDTAQMDITRKDLDRHFLTLARQLGDGPYLLGRELTIADPYLFVMLTWAAMFQLEVPAPLPAYVARMKQLPSVVRAFAEEGLS